MVGAICRWDIIAHPFVTIQCFGWRVFLRALIANHNQTFLSLLVRTGSLQPPKARIPELVDRCIKLELQAQRIYEWLAGRFLGNKPICDFFEALARQEKTHAEILGLCRESASRSVWREEFFSPCRDAIPRLERQMAEVAVSLISVDGVSEALRQVIQIEGSEINRAFESVVEASGSEFVKKVRAFQTAVAEHISFICDEILKLEPDLAEQCHELAGGLLVGTG